MECESNFLLIRKYLIMSVIFTGMPSNIFNILGNFLHSYFQLCSCGIPKLCIAMQKYFGDFTEILGYKKDTLGDLIHFPSSTCRSNILLKHNKDNGSTKFFQHNCR